MSSPLITIKDSLGKEDTNKKKERKGSLTTRRERPSIAESERNVPEITERTLEV